MKNYVIYSLSSIALLSCGAVVAGPHNSSFLEDADPILKPQSIGKTKVSLPSKSKQQMGGDYRRPAVVAQVADDWTVKSNILRADTGGGESVVRIMYICIDDKKDLDDFKSPPDLLQTSYRRIKGNGWTGYIERKIDPDIKKEAVWVNLTKGNLALTLSITWPRDSSSSRAICNEVIKSIVWTIKDVKD